MFTYCNPIHMLRCITEAIYLAASTTAKHILQVSICRTLLDIVNGISYLHELGLLHA